VIRIWKKTVSLIAIVGVILFTVFNTELYPLLKSGDIETIIASFKGNIVNQLTFSLIIMVIQNSFTLIPLILVITLNYTLFGFVNGFIWSWVTSIIAAAIMFVGSRYYFQNWVVKKTDPKLLAKMEDNGLLFVFQARIFPFVPTSLINILGGVSSIKFKDFIIGTITGNFIFFFLLSLIPAGLMSGKTNDLILIIITLVLLAFVLLFRYKIKQKRKREVG
jgi:uncharacterized membrane protein YdjX (TVP38/TMEM64 family)